LTARNAALVAALALIGALAYLTLSVAVEHGVDVLVIVSVIVLALLGFGVLGALTAPPDE
jgi:predicted neutral ceramidase superfamily lipid hydrolase